MDFVKNIGSSLAILFLFLGCSGTEKLTESNSENQQPLYYEIERPIPYPLDIPNAFERAINSNTRSTDGRPGGNYWQNEASYKLHANLDTENHTVRGKAEITYINNSPTGFEAMVVELAQNLHKEGTPKKELTEITGGKELESLTLNGNVLEEITVQMRFMEGRSGYIVDGTRLYIFLDGRLNSGESLNLDIEWSFEVPEEGASGRMGRSRDNLYMIAYWYPQVAVFDDVYGWMDDNFLGNAEFYHGFADYELSITAPEGWIVMATGEFLNPEETLSSQTLARYIEAGNSDDLITIVNFDEFEQATATSDDGTLTWNFYSDKVRDVAFSATLESRWDGARTSVGDLNGDGNSNYTRIHSLYRETAPLWRDQVDYAQHSITFLSDYLNLPYPWPHMTSVEGADIIGGGMEFPMITIMGDYNRAGAVSLYGVTAHEIAHMWYPMIISTNERRYTWIDEGFTTFHTQQANIDYWGKDRFSNSDLFAGYLRIAGTDFEGEMMRWSDFHYPGPAYGVASYPKPASVLTALRGLLGEELFMKALHELTDRWKYKHPYPWDVFNTFEDVSERDLSWFWRSWYYENWTLDQSIKNVVTKEDEIIIEIEDLGNIPMPVLLRIELEDGTVLDAELDMTDWLNGLRTTQYRMSVDSPVVKVEIDPDVLFPDVDRSNNVWQRED